MNIGLRLYTNLSGFRPLPFSKSDVLFCLFSHDLEKPWKYEKGPDGTLHHREDFKTKKSHHDFRIKKLKEYEILPTPEQENGIKYTEGELDDYTNKKKL